MRGYLAGVAAFGAAMALAPAANAGVNEVHVGVMAHNICVTNCKNADKEDGPNVEFQVSFDSPSFLNWAGSPQPYILASVNVAGETSFGGVGLEWRWDFAVYFIGSNFHQSFLCFDKITDFLSPVDDGRF